MACTGSLSLFLPIAISVGHQQLFCLGVGRPEQWRSEDYWVPCAVLTEGPVLPMRYVSGVPRGVSRPPPPQEIPKALQNRAKLNPIVKTVKNC